jgi:hypothetical protein
LALVISRVEADDEVVCAILTQLQRVVAVDTAAAAFPGLFQNVFKF